MVDYNVLTLNPLSASTLLDGERYGDEASHGVDFLGRFIPTKTKSKQTISPPPPFNIKTSGVLVVHFRGKNAVVVSLRVFNFSLKRSTAGAFAAPFRVLGRNEMAGDNVLFLNWYLLGISISSHAHKPGSWYLLGYFSKYRTSIPVPLIRESSPPLRPLVSPCSPQRACLQAETVVTVYSTDVFQVFLNPRALRGKRKFVAVSPTSKSIKVPDIRICNFIDMLLL